MFPGTLLSCLLTCLSVAAVASASQPGDEGWTKKVPDIIYDVLIIGGGPSGLSSLSSLGRTRRNTLLLDSASYRNGLTRGVHDVIGIDGLSPAAFRYNARQLISRYPTVHWKNATVNSLKQLESGKATLFSVGTEAGEKFRAKKLILGTGLTDILPATPGFKENWARGIFWCPWCDGWEHRDQRAGILGPINDAVGAVQELILLNPDIIIFANGTDNPINSALLDTSRPGWRKILKGYNVTIENRLLASIHRTQDGAVVFDKSKQAEYDRFSVKLVDGTTIVRDSFLANVKNTQKTWIGRELGIQYWGDRYAVNQASMRTNVQGVFAIGDANSGNTTNVPHALFSGKRAAVFVHVELEKERSATFLEKRIEIDVESSHDLLKARDLEELYENMKG